MGFGSLSLTSLPQATYFYDVTKSQKKLSLLLSIFSVLQTPDREQASPCVDFSVLSSTK